MSEVPTDPRPMDFADVFVILKPQDDWVFADDKEELIDKMKEAVSIITGVNYEFTQPLRQGLCNKVDLGISFCILKRNIQYNVFQTDTVTLLNRDYISCFLKKYLS